MRLSERIVVLIVNALIIVNVHARGPGDCCSNVQAKDERFHFVVVEPVARVYVRFLPRLNKVIAISCVHAPYQ